MRHFFAESRVCRRKKKPSDPEDVTTRVWERKKWQWGPRGEIMSTYKASSGGSVGLEKKKEAARPEMRNYVNP